ncbi:MAG: IS200/IS605 family transposase [Planctomycetes bacterium]|nr:IS200/IS605 family transposase [Planctomycetota bacterium]
MAQSLSNILLHIVFSTKYREPLITVEHEDELWRYLAGACRATGCHAHRIGGMADHVHLLCGLGRTIPVSKLVEQLKRPASKWMKTQGVSGFAWQNGYGAFSIGQSQFDDVAGYIGRQKEHHRRLTFQEEFRAFLTRYRVEYDERYVWD